MEKFIDLGCAEPRNPPWASLIAPVQTPDSTFRFCVDYRSLYAVTVRDVYFLPRIPDTLHLLGGHRYFTSPDLLSGYFQASLSKAAKLKTAFITPRGLYQFRVLAMSLANSPAVFQRGEF